MNGWHHIEPYPQCLTESENRVKELLQRGWKYPMIAMQLKISHETAIDIIYEIRKKEGIMRGNPITADERSAILAMYATKTPVKEIASKVNRDISTVYKIIRGKDLTEAQKIAAENEARVAAELEDVENGIPNTPLVSANTEQKFENAEKNAEKAEFQSLPFCVQIAVDRYIKDLKLEIEEREQRIVELQNELDDARMKLHDSIEFRRKYRAKVDAVEDLK